MYSFIQFKKANNVDSIKIIRRLKNVEKIGFFEVSFWAGESAAEYEYLANRHFGTVCIFYDFPFVF